MAIDWSDNTSNERLLAATHAALGKESYANRFGEIAHYYGNGATYYAIKNRYTKIAEQAEQMQLRRGLAGRPSVNIGRIRHSSNTIIGLPRKRRRTTDETPTAEPDSDDESVIRQGLFRTPAPRLRNASARQPRVPRSSSSEWVSRSESEDISVSHGGRTEVGAQYRYHDQVFDDTPRVPPSPAVATVRSSSTDSIVIVVDADINTNTNTNADAILSKRLTLDAHLPLDERMTRSSQELAEQRVRERQRYLDPPSLLHRSDETPTPMQPPTAPAQSFINPLTKTCMLCMLRWEDLKNARTHELASKKHQINLQIHELVEAARRELADALKSSGKVLAATTQAAETGTQTSSFSLSLPSSQSSGSTSASASNSTQNITTSSASTAPTTNTTTTTTGRFSRSPSVIEISPPPPSSLSFFHSASSHTPAMANLSTTSTTTPANNSKPDKGKSRYIPSPSPFPSSSPFQPPPAQPALSSSFSSSTPRTIRRTLADETMQLAARIRESGLHELAETSVLFEEVALSFVDDTSASGSGGGDGTSGTGGGGGGGGGRRGGGQGSSGGGGGGRVGSSRDSGIGSVT